ncbi:MAG: DNA repair exonuclease [Alphaproteobacteria bacterium]|nr:DNA repair exonuclease [Alphaproteobacteria bacterium]
MARFVHTADLQLGMPFHWIKDDPGARAREARLEAIERIGQVARDHRATFIVIAGDLFDANTVDDRVVVQACDRLRAVDLPVYVIPGNHDHGGADSVYRAERFRRVCPDNLQVLMEPAPQLVDSGTVLLPAPLLRRKVSASPTRHLTAELGRDLAPDGVRVGLAHGTVQGFGEVQATNLVDPELARTTDLDYLALGDWHGLKQVSDRAWYAGAPEPTSFKENDPGHVLVVDIPEHGRPPEVQPVHVARTRWVRHDAQLYTTDHVEALDRWFQDIDDPRHTLVRLELEGVLSLTALERLAHVLEVAEARLLHLRRRGPGVLPAPTADELASIATDGYVKTAVDALRARTESTGADAATAARALQLLYRLRVGS